jgi:hypothetical protein
MLTEIEKPKNVFTDSFGLLELMLLQEKTEQHIAD